KREYNTQRKTNCAFQVLKSIISDYPNEEFVYIIGGDSMIHFHTWVRPDIISKLMPIAVVARKGYYGLTKAIENARKRFDAQIIELPMEGDEVSSSLIKAQFELERKSPFVCEKATQIIKTQGLYTDFQNTINKLKSNISCDLFRHCKSTVFFAMGFVNKLNLKYEQVFLSALLHDCAKEIPPPERYKHIPHKIVHQFYGSELANEIYDIKDEKILSAIRYHTTGRAGMSDLEKLIYSADMLEDLRNFSGVENLRRTIKEDFEKGFFECVKHSINRFKKTQRDIYYLSLECYDYYNKRTLSKIK
ncbi:MAG: HD domain-containing protein, partial [Bacillota bacterium]